MEFRIRNLEFGLFLSFIIYSFFLPFGCLLLKSNFCSPDLVKTTMPHFNPNYQFLINRQLAFLNKFSCVRPRFGIAMLVVFQCRMLYKCHLLQRFLYHFTHF